jgi:hypothetical protein
MMNARLLALAALAMAPPQAPAASPAQTYLGRWDVTLRTPERTHSSWLEVREENGELRVRMVGRWGHARLLPQAAIVNGHLRFVSPKEEEGRPDDMVFDGVRVGDQLKGTTNGLHGVTWTWRGERAPALAAAKPPRWDSPIRLFDGKDMSAWKALNAAGKPWRVAGGALVSPGAGGTDLRSVAEFGDFKLHLEFKAAAGANSGVYLRGRYELQIENDPQPEAPNMRTGGIYGHLAPSVPAPRTPGVWQTFDVTLVGRYVTVVLNGKTLIEHQEIPGITGGALDSREAADGPLVLQGSEYGQVSYRNIVITPAVKKP